MIINRECNRDQLCHEVSVELNLPIDIVKEIVDFQFSELGRHIKENDARDFMLEGVGSFVFWNQKGVEHLVKNKDWKWTQHKDNNYE